jgi:triacylglycerol esterase/lipase EstA (alpha/beta hydrolase family)
MKSVEARLIRALSAAALLVTISALSAPVASAQLGESQTEGHRIVVLVPGQQAIPGTSSLDQFDDMEVALTAEGYTVHTVNVKGLDLPADTRVVKAAVESATEGVDVESLAIVGHSYGGLSSRSYLKTLGGSDIVDTYIAIGTPQYGTPPGCLLPAGYGFDGCPLTPFIGDLVDGDDTPGDTAYYSIRSDEELADGRLDGGQCRLAPIKGLQHEVEPSDKRVIAAVSSALAGGCPGEFVDDADGTITRENSLFPAPTR